MKAGIHISDETASQFAVALQSATNEGDRARLLESLERQLRSYADLFLGTGQRSLAGLAQRTLRLVTKSKCDLTDHCRDEIIESVLAKLSKHRERHMRATIDALEQTLDELD